MVQVHGAQVQQLVAQTPGLAPERLVAVPIDVGKSSAAALVCDFTGELLAGRFQFALTRVGWLGWSGGCRRCRPPGRWSWSGSGSRPLATIIGR